MCGIAGIVLAPGVAGRADREAALAMARALRHRGPDGERAWAGEAPLGPGREPWAAALGHARLAVIDTSEAAAEPLANEDGTLLLVFNGEVYDHRAHRAALEPAGHRWRSRCDAEAVVHAHEAWGDDAIARLRGMFAYALLDRAAGRLVLARDAAGKKPLHYAAIEREGRLRGLVFASEPGAIFAAGPLVPREPDREALDDFLAVGYIPSPRSAFRAIRRLEPGSALALEDGRIRTWRYARFGEPGELPRGDVRRRLRAAIEDAVRARLESDVPLGAFLSGGIDSTIVTALLARLAGGRPATFSIGFDDPRFDETRYARIAARRIGTDHHELRLDARAYEALPDVIRAHGEPFADESALATFALARFARSRVTVALTGDGGDELFLGYRHQQAGRALAALDRAVPRWALRAAARLAPRPGPEKSLRRQAARLLGALGDDEAGRYLAWTAIFRERGAGIERLVRARGGIDRYDMEIYLPDDILAKVDRATMAHGLEARSPLLDREVVRLAAAIPARRKSPFPWRGKQVLIDACRDLLPPEIVARPKMGFGVPVGTWFRGPLRALVRETLLAERALARGIVGPEVVRALIDDHERGAAENGRKLHALLALETWFRVFGV